jgi:hypothetical protein
MLDAIDELVARSNDCPELRAFHEFHQAHPEVLDFFVVEIRVRIENGFDTFSYHSLWEYARWKLELQAGPGRTFLMNDHAAPLYARAITILHPEFNGRAEFRKSAADDIFGTRIDPSTLHPESYARKLRWANGTALESGWRPSRHHVPTHKAKRRPDVHRKTA